MKCVWAPISNTCPLTPKMYGAWSVSLFSHYSYLPINIILSLLLHWQINAACCCTPQEGSSPSRHGICSSRMTGRACLEGMESHLAIQGCPVSPHFSWNTVSSLWCMWDFFLIFKFSQYSENSDLTLVCAVIFTLTWWVWFWAPVWWGDIA